MRLYTYVVARDFGFAPNPFFGFCTLATCKPKIRSSARVGDWIVGTGSKAYRLAGRIVYAMRVCERLSFEEYWIDPRFRLKRPNLKGSVKQAFGDNIYHRHSKTRRWVQENSHHSYSDGRPNQGNVKHDTQTSSVLISSDFAYWGASGPQIPVRFRGYRGLDVCAQRGHKCNFPADLSADFAAWIRSLGPKGYVGEPAEFSRG